MGRVTRRGRMMVSNASQSVAKRMKKAAKATKSLMNTPSNQNTISGVGRKQKILHIGKAVWGGDGFLRAAQECRQTFGHLRAEPNGALDDFSEFGGMRRGENDSTCRSLVSFREGLPAKYADSGV